MARFCWWEQMSKTNDFASPSNMTKGEVWTIVYGFYTLLLFILILFVSSLGLADDVMMQIVFFCMLVLASLTTSLPMYIHTVILPRKDNKQYVAGCTTLLATACISSFCACLSPCDAPWDAYIKIITGACLIVNGIIALVYLFGLDKQAKQEGKTFSVFPQFIHMGWFLIPVVALVWVMF